MTSLPADKIGLDNLGRIEEGAWSDLVIFDYNNINDRSKYTDPHHFPEGIMHVIVNGKLVVKDEKTTGAKPGRWLRR